ncbi:hypothetical protein B0T22DRAFT_486792 [Podospora appendiculata]|uniref:Uncharacterized protein n=1 Tax=Podospora appendiculata TaxID=314037 RepID=A0AAE0XGM2_9PEZI|nr:hypothetical protein B0T22DRAFT_486792 [Podospora appendiculata]
MSSIGRIAGSAVSITNDNTVAIVNINLDFSLWRCDPAPEFIPIAGFLFHEIIPDAPKLIKAYGRRVSEILAGPDINPQGTESDGPFQPFIGVDCTSIWAAATSGSASIGVLLLACMLADAFDAKVATATWVEIIKERKRRVQADVDAQKLVNPHTAAAAQQEFTRDELASGGSTYETVTLTWSRAMETEATKVSFNDPLLPNSGILSLGLEYKGKPSEGFWNIPYTSFDTTLAWFEELGKKLRPDDDQVHKLSWLLQLCAATTNLDGDARQVAPLLVKYG